MRMNTHGTEDLLQVLPYGRRFARALAGDQDAGDALVAASLRAGLPPLRTRLAMYAGIAAAAPSTTQTGTAQAGPTQPEDRLTHQERCLLLLVNLEQLSVPEAAQVLGLAPDAAQAAVAAAQDRIRRAASTDILIIEDEPVIAMDIRLLVERCGHRVVGVASSEAAAVSLAATHKPGLILADVNLGIGGDGVAAVRRILARMPVPVIFVTAYPERLLTAAGPEPAFVINKPFDSTALAIATYQATTAGRLPIV